LGFHSFFVEDSQTKDRQSWEEELVLFLLRDLDGVIVDLLYFITKRNFAIERSEILDATNGRKEVADWSGARNRLGASEGINDVIGSELLIVTSDYVLAKFEGPNKTVLGD
jgi:hypothetical protein